MYNIVGILVALETACLIYLLLPNYCEKDLLLPNYWEKEVNGLRDVIDVYGIKDHLHIDVFGQPFVHEILPKVLKEYNEQQKSGPLILAFHGTPGVGKSFVSNILAQKLFVRGQKSEFFHMFLATKDFPATTNRLQLIKHQKYLRFRLVHMCDPNVDGYFYCLLQSVLRHFFNEENTFCRRLFVFDEVDSLPDNLLDMVSSLMVSPFFTKTIFVFLSNVGGQEIYEEIETHEIHNFTKDEIDHKKFVKIVQDALVNSPRKYNPFMVHQIIPFLPLERKHVTMCIRKEITRRNPWIRERFLIKLTENVLKELLFYGFQDNYSTKGCKNVVEKVNLVLARDKLRK